MAHPEIDLSIIPDNLRDLRPHPTEDIGGVYPTHTQQTEYMLGYAEGQKAAAYITAQAAAEEKQENDAIIAEKDVLIAEQEDFMEELVDMSGRDKMTGLLNKPAWARDVETRMSLRLPFVIHVLDMDAFKSVNDTLGHGRGDELLIAFAERFDSRFKRESDAVTHQRYPDVVSRWGGDEFAKTSGLENREVTDGQSPRTIPELVQEQDEYIQAVVDEFVAEQPEDIRNLGFDISIGRAYWDPTTDISMTPKQLFDQADAAMYEAKRRNKSR